MAKESVASKLRALKKAWRTVTPRTGGGLPDGDYEGVIKTALVGLSKASDRLQCVWTIEATAPEGYEGRKQNKIAGLETEDNLAWFKGDLSVLGIDPPDDIDEVPGAAGQSEGLAIAFKVRTKQEFTNVDFIGLLEDVETKKSNDSNDNDDSDGVKDEVTTDEVIAMGEADDEKELQAIIDEYSLDIDQDEYETYPEVAKLIIEKLSL